MNKEILSTQQIYKMYFRQDRHSRQQRERDEIIRVMCAVLSAFVFLMFFASTTRASEVPIAVGPLTETESNLPVERTLLAK